MNNFSIDPTDLESSVLREQRRAEELAYLYQFALDLMTQPDGNVRMIYESVPAAMLTVLRCDGAVILLTDDANSTLHAVAALGEAYSDQHAFAELIAEKRWASVKSGAMGSVLGAPLHSRDVLLGVLIAYRASADTPFSDNEIQLITVLAGVTGAVLSNARLRQRLDERLSLLQTVLESSPTGLAIIEQSRLLMANPAALHALGLNESAFDQLLLIDGPDGLLLERLLEGLPPSAIASFEYRIERERRPRFLRIEVVPFGSDKLLAQVNDVTLLREIESRREEAVASTSHDLKTPLAVMNLGLSSLLSYYEQMPDEDRRTMIEETLEQVGEMKTLISSLLDHSRPHKPHAADVPPQVADPAFYVGQVVHELSAFARYHGITLRWHASSDGSLHLHCLPDQLKTIVRNLITNAIKYTASAGEVTISTSEGCEANRFRLEVTDTGVGIPEAELDAIFELAYRASTHGSAEGGGLGLSLVHSLVVQLGGTVSVYSTVGVGSTFVVMLPCTTQDI